VLSHQPHEISDHVQEVLTMLRTLLIRVRWSVVIPLLVFAPVTVPVTADAAYDVAHSYLSYLETVKQEGQCPAGTHREGCE